MNKSDLIGRIAGDAGITKAQAASALNSFTSATAEALKKGDKVIFDFERKNLGFVIGKQYNLGSWHAI